MLAQRGEARLLRGAANVLRILTPNARAIFRVLADEMLANPGEHGMAWSKLYTACREQFVVASENTLRTHLQEFTDHQLAKQVKRADGVQMVVLPFSPDDIQQVLVDIASAG